MGKRNFKRHLELFFPALKYSLVCSSLLVKTAAELCVGALSQLLGPSIFLGRVEQFDAYARDLFEAAQRSATAMAARPTAQPLSSMNAILTTND